MINKYLKKFPPTTSYQPLITGFTLIELLVAISIIGILISMAAPRYIVAEKQARDTKRKSDLNQYRVALENYAVAHDSLYPGICNPATVTALCAFSISNSNFQALYLSGSCLQDPRVSSTYFYIYCSDSGGTKYVLVATLETGDYYEVCSNGRSGKLTSLDIGDDGSTCTLP